MQIDTSRLPPIIRKTLFKPMTKIRNILKRNIKKIRMQIIPDKRESIRVRTAWRTANGSCQEAWAIVKENRNIVRDQ